MLKVLTTVYMYMSKLTLKNLNLFDILSKQHSTLIRTPEPTELCELDSVMILADWLDSAPRDNVISQELYIEIYIYIYIFKISRHHTYYRRVSRNLFMI